MSQFKFLADMNKLQTLDGELRMTTQPRWKKKMESSMNGSINASKLSISYNNSYAAIGNTTATGSKTPNKSMAEAGGSKKKTPSEKKSPGRKTPTQGSNGSRTPSGAAGGDRFIPNRGAMNFDLGHYLMKQEPKKESNENSHDGSNIQESDDKVRALSEALIGVDISKKRILAYQTKAPSAPESHLNPLRVVYSVKTPMSTKSGTRYINSNPVRILDAPDIINDYYLNLLDWSSDNIVTVALGSAVYLWNAGTGNIEVLFENEDGDHACSLAWIQEGHILAVGTSSGSVELWDCNKRKRLRVMTGHSARVGALAWNSYNVTSGSRDGSIIHHDVRQREHLVATLTGHTQEVCGLKWSPDFKYLASGGNDNLVNIWSTEMGSVSTGSTPVHVLNQHQAAVRALAWCPWKSNILATGGGTADRCIKIWNTSNGTCTNSIDTKSQVCSLLFSKNDYKELISAHGFANNQLTVWKYPSMVKQADLVGHTQRVLQMAMSPDGSTVMSAGADETLRLWNCFAPDPKSTKKKTDTTNDKTSSMLKQSIR